MLLKGPGLTPPPQGYMIREQENGSHPKLDPSLTANCGLLSNVTTSTLVISKNTSFIPHLLCINTVPAEDRPASQSSPMLIT